MAISYHILLDHIFLSRCFETGVTVYSRFNLRLTCNGRTLVKIDCEQDSHSLELKSMTNCEACRNVFSGELNECLLSLPLLNDAIEPSFIQKEEV